MCADPLPWLLASAEPAARWVALTQLLDLPPDHADVRRARRDVVADLATASLVARLPDWTEDQHLSGHATPTFGPHLLGLLADMGVAAGDFPQVDRLLDTMTDHQEASGRFPSYGVAASGQAPVWGALLCDSHAVLDVLVRFGRHDDPRVRAGLERMAADAVDTTQGRAWPCLPHSVSGWRGPGRREDACPMVTLQALRTFSRLPSALRPDDVAPIARVLLRCWRERGSEKPYQFGHGKQFKTVKWPPSWYGAYAVVDTIGRYPRSGTGRAPRQRRVRSPSSPRACWPTTCPVTARSPRARPIGASRATRSARSATRRRLRPRCCSPPPTGSTTWPPTSGRSRSVR